MKKGKTINELAAQVTELRERSRDYRVSQSILTMADDLTLRTPATAAGTQLAIEPNELFHAQLADKMGIPGRYYSRMRAEAPALLRSNVNHWLAENSDKRFLRTATVPAANLFPEPVTRLEGRAFLGNQYKPLDNYDMMEAIMPPLMHTGLTVKSSEITEKRLYIQVVTEKITAEVKKGDAVQLGLIVSNSEVGCGAMSIQVLVYRLACLNGLIVGDDLPNFRKVHVGREFTAADDVLREETKRLKDAAIWAEARDVISAAVKQTTLDGIVERLRGIAAVKLEDPENAVELVAKRFDLVEDERKSVMRNLIEGGDVSQWGLVNAVTALAHTAASYDRVVEIEAIGGKLAAMNLGSN